jgi:hypothetical protein
LRQGRCAIAAIALGIFCPTAFAQESPSHAPQAQGAEAATADHSSWSFSASPYVWFAGLSGDVGVNRNLPAVHVDVDFSEVFDSIDWLPPPVMVVGEARYGRLAVITDFMYLGLAADREATLGPVPVAAALELDTIIWTFGGSFRAVETDRVSLDLLAGARLWNVDASGTLAGPLAVRQRSGSKTWVDPIIGIAGRVELGGGFALQAEGDAGGFGLASDIDWQLLGTVQYEIAKTVVLAAGYRYLAVDYDDGGFLFDVAIHGPIIGAGFRF